MAGFPGYNGGGFNGKAIICFESAADEHETAFATAARWEEALRDPTRADEDLGDACVSWLSKEVWERLSSERQTRAQGRIGDLAMAAFPRQL